MTRYDTILARGQTMPPKEIDATIKSLAADPRFAAVLRMLEVNRLAFANAGSAQAIANFHGTLAHCAGSVHAIQTIEGQLRGLIDKAPKASGMQRAEEEE